MPTRDPQRAAANRARELPRLRERRRLRRAGLLGPGRTLRFSVLDPEDYAHPNSDVRRGP